MLNLSPSQLVKLWHELETCYYKDNRYGKDTAEIYEYTLCQNEPNEYFSSKHRKSTQQAGENLSHVIKMFEEMRNCEITIDGYPFNEWFKESGRVSHRVHVKVIRKEK